MGLWAVRGGRRAVKIQNLGRLTGFGEGGPSTERTGAVTAKTLGLFIPSCNTDQGVLQYEEYVGGKPNNAQ